MRVIFIIYQSLVYSYIYFWLVLYDYLHFWTATARKAKTNKEVKIKKDIQKWRIIKNTWESFFHISIISILLTLFLAGFVCVWLFAFLNSQASKLERQTNKEVLPFMHISCANCLQTNCYYVHNLNLFSKLICYQDLKVHSAWIKFWICFDTKSMLTCM